PEFSAVIPGLQIRPVIDPEVWREVSLVVVAGRRFSPAASAFVNSVKAHGWPESALAQAIRKTAA
ncbi:LysR family transcriptional regulator, partial [Mesorhizobium sp. M4A.F.Ca.ET.029.04.2.1]